MKRMDRGTMGWRLTDEEGIAVRWRDSNPVTLLSNEYEVNPVQKCKIYSVKYGWGSIRALLQSFLECFQKY